MQLFDKNFLKERKLFRNLHFSLMQALQKGICLHSLEGYGQCKNLKVKTRLHKFLIAPATGGAIVTYWNIMPLV